MITTVTIYVLVVMMHVNSGGIVNFQEFNSLENCQYAAKLVNERAKNVTYDRVDAFCIKK